LFLLSACGPTVKYEDYGAAVVKSQCAWFVRCGIAQSEATCAPLIAARSGQVGDILNSYRWAKGKIRYDEARAGRCLAAIEKASCAGFGAGSDEDCRLMFSGQAKVGEACNAYECVPDAVCSLEVGVPCPGVCRARVAEGGTAQSAAECAAGLVFQSGTCRKAVAKGGACTTSEQCAPNLNCTSAGTCQDFLAADAACTGPGECSPYFACVSGKCAVPPASGQPCNLSILECKLELACSAATGSSVCAARLKAGDTCSLDSQCEVGMWCGATGGPSICQVLAKASESCATQRCGLGFFCEAAGKTCKPQLDPGASCSTSEVGNCSGGACDNGTCVIRNNLFACP
jgi:hypothetical protein